MTVRILPKGHLLREQDSSIPPHTLPSGRPLDRVHSCLNPLRGLLPSLPQGRRGEFLRKLTILSQLIKTASNDIVLK